MINFLKKWECHVGSMKVSQTVEARGDDKLVVLSGFHTVHRYHCGASYIPFADHEKLSDPAFRLEIARRDIAALVKELRSDAEYAEKALAVTP